MVVVNVTPDSFSDGGLYLNREAAIEHGLELEREGASILDVGGESTRPGAQPVADPRPVRPRSRTGTTRAWAMRRRSSR